MSEKSYQRIMAALDVLRDEGLTHIQDEYKKGYPRFRAIGLAIASVDDSGLDFLNLAYSALEEHNYHSQNLVLEWAFKLYNQDFHERDLATLSQMLSRRDVTILYDWDDSKSYYKKRRVNVRVVIEDATDE